MVYECGEAKYNYAALFAPYADFILEKAVNFMQKVISNGMDMLTPLVVNYVLKIFDDINRIGFVFNETNQEAKGWVKILNNHKQEVFRMWNNGMRDRLYNLDAEIEDGENNVILQDMIKPIQSDINDTKTICDEDVLAYLKEVEQRLEPVARGLNIKARTNYIIDTNIFMDEPDIINKFDLGRDKVIVPRSMEQELDGLAHDPIKGEAPSRALKLIRKKQKDNPQFLNIKDDVKRELLPVGFDHDKKDNDILATAIELDKKDMVIGL